MLSSALTTVLSQAWSGHFRRQKAESGGDKEEKELRQEVGDWAHFLKPPHPFTWEAPGFPSNNNNTPMSPPFQDGDIFPGSDYSGGAPTGSGMAFPLTLPKTPHVSSTHSLDYHCHRRASQAGPRFSDPSSMLRPKPTTSSSLLLSFRRLSSTRGSPSTTFPHTNTPPPSPLPSNTATNINHNLLRSCDNVTSPSNMSTSTSRHVHTPKSTTSSRNTATFGPNHNLNSQGTHYLPHALLNPYVYKTTLNPPNASVCTYTPVRPKSQTTPDNLKGLNTLFSSITPVGTDTHLSPKAPITYNTLRNPNMSNTLFSFNTPRSASTSLSPNTSIIPDTVKSPNTPYTPFSINTSTGTYTTVSPNYPISPDTLKSPNTSFSPIVHASTYIPLKPNTPITYNTLRNPSTPSTPFSPNTRVGTVTPVSHIPPITPDILKSPNTAFSPMTHVNTNTPASQNPPLTYSTIRHLNTPSTLFNPEASISTKTPASPNAPITYSTIRSHSTPPSPKTPVGTNTLITYNTLECTHTPNSPISTRTSISTDTSSSSNAFNRHNSGNILNRYKNHSDGNAETVDTLMNATINSQNTPLSLTHVSSPPYTSFNQDRKVARLFTSSTQPVEDRAKENQAINPSSGQPGCVTSGCSDKGKGGPETFCWPISPTHHQPLRRTPHTMEEHPISSSFRTAAQRRRQDLGFPPTPCLSSPNPDQIMTPRRCNLPQGLNSISRFTFDNFRDPLLLKSQTQAPMQNTHTPNLCSAHPLYRRDPELSPYTLSPHHGPWLSDRLWAVPMDTTGDITSPHVSEPVFDMWQVSPAAHDSVSAHVVAQPQSNNNASCKTSQDVSSFIPETRLMPSASSIGAPMGMRTETTLSLSGLQHPLYKPHMSPNPACTEHFNPSITCRCATATGTKPKGIVGKNEFDSVVKELISAPSMKQQPANKSLLMFRIGKSNLSPSVSGKAGHPVTPMCDGTGKALGEGNKGSTKIDPVLSSMEVTKHMQNLDPNAPGQVSEGDRAREADKWQGSGVPLNLEYKTGRCKPRRLQESQVMYLPTESTQPEPKQVGSWHGLKNGYKNLSCRRYATVPGKRSSNEARWRHLDYSQDDMENENVFYSTTTNTTYPRSQRSLSFCEPEHARQFISTHGNNPRGQQAIRRESLYSLSPSLSPSPIRAFGLHRRRSFSVSSVHSSRPSSCGHISTGPKFGGSHDFYTMDVDAMPSGLVDLGGNVQQKAPRSSPFSMGQDTAFEKICSPCQLETPPSFLPSTPESPRHMRRISTASTSSHTSQDTASSRGHFLSRGDVSSLFAFDESDSDTTTDDEYYLSPDCGERETEL